MKLRGNPCLRWQASKSISDRNCDRNCDYNLDRNCDCNYDSDHNRNSHWNNNYNQNLNGAVIVIDMITIIAGASKDIPAVDGTATSSIESKKEQ